MENTPGSAGTPKEYRESSQVSRVDSTTQYMTLTVGGDDLHFSDIGHACAEYSLFSKTGYIGAKVSCAKEISNQETHMLSLESDLEGLYAQLLSAAAPGAELVVAGYPKILPSTYPKNLTRLHGTPFCTFDHLHGIGSIGMPVPDAKRVAKFISDLNHAIQDAVSSASQAYPGQVMYADVYPTSIPRNCKGTTPNATVAGIELSPRGTGIGPGGLISTATFHPTKAGQAVYAKAVQATFDAFTTSRGAIAFDDSAGTAPPPSDLGGHSLTPLSEWFGNEGDYINELDGPTGSLDFSGYGAIAQIGSGWATWSQDYGGDVLEFGDFGADSSVTITLPPGTTAFYLYAEPDEFATYDMVASANNGTTSGDETVYGDSGASFFGFYTTRPGVAIESVSISTSDDFAIGEFGISNQ
jgi:hypothetical protein